MRGIRAQRSLHAIGGAVSVLAVLAASATGRADEHGASAPRRHLPKRPMPWRRAPPNDAGAAASPGPPAPDASPDDDDSPDDDADPPSGSGAPGPAPDHGGRDASVGHEEDVDDGEDGTAVELGADLAVDSRVVFRGLAESRGAVVQPSVWHGLYGLTATGWAAFLLNAEGDRNALDLVAADGSLSYAYRWKRLQLEPAVNFYYFPQGLLPAATIEASIEISIKIGDFSIVNGNNVDVHSRPGAYFGTLGATYGRALGPWTVGAVANAGFGTAAYNDEYLGREVATVDVVQAGLSSRYDIGDHLYLELHTELCSLVAPELRALVREPTLLAGGVSFGVEYRGRK